MKISVWLLVLPLLGFFGNSACAGSIPIVNYSFENPPLSPGGYNTTGDATQAGNTIIPGWGVNVIFGAGVAYSSLATDGHQIAYINSDNHGYYFDNIYQDVGALKPNTTYTLTVAVGTTGSVNDNIPVGDATIVLVNGTNYPGDAYDASSNETVLASTTSVISQTSTSLTDISTTYTTGAIVSGDLTIVLANTTPALINHSFQDAFDNVRLDASPAVSGVPEPASSTLLSIGLTVMGGCALRRKHKSA